jgi:hypothetical protein
MNHYFWLPLIFIWVNVRCWQVHHVHWPMPISSFSLSCRFSHILPSFVRFNERFLVSSARVCARECAPLTVDEGLRGATRGDEGRRGDDEGMTRGDEGRGSGRG